MKNMIVATDFSPAALHAAEYAVEMAKAIKLNILLVHVFQIPVVYSEITLVMCQEEMRLDAEGKIKQLKDDLNRKTKGELFIETEVIEGLFFHELKMLCEKIKPYVVVMGSQGTTASDRFIFGNHAVHAMKNLEWPLITVPKGSTYSAIKKIGLACDLDDEIENAAMNEIKTLVNDLKAELHIVNTGNPGKYSSNTEPVTIEKKLKPLKPEYHLMSNKNTDEAIIDFADRNNIDLLIMLPKRHGFFDQFIHKSHTKQMVLHSHVPVMSLHHSHS